jgi:hypothetical protein
MSKVVQKSPKVSEGGLKDHAKLIPLLVIVAFGLPIYLCPV